MYNIYIYIYAYAWGKGQTVKGTTGMDGYILSDTNLVETLVLQDPDRHAYM